MDFSMWGVKASSTTPVTPKLWYILEGAPPALGYSSTKWCFNLNKIFSKDARAQMSSNEPKWAQIS